MIRDQLREAYRAFQEIHQPELNRVPDGSTYVTEIVAQMPDELVVEDPECDVLPIHVEVAFIDFTLSLTKSTDDRIVYERDR